MACVRPLLLHLRLLLLLLLLLLGADPAHTKYVLETQRRTRNSARSYCRTNHLDLAPVESVAAQEELRSLARATDLDQDYIWMGLERDGQGGWRWSGGGRATVFFWDSGEPGNTGEQYGLIKEGLWHDAGGEMRQPFFCLAGAVVSTPRGWEAALEHCRGRHRDLASVSSATEAELLGAAAAEHGARSGEPLWIGLRFLAGRWLWTDGRPLGSWGGESAPLCPPAGRTCGALRVEGRPVWEPRDCQEQLPSLCY